MEPRSGTKKSSFKAEMEELLRPPPASIDPEAWGQEGATLEESDEELYDVKGKGREVSRLRGSIDMGDEEAYMGKRASRDGFFGAGTGRELRKKTSDPPSADSSDDDTADEETADEETADEETADASADAWTGEELDKGGSLGSGFGVPSAPYIESDDDMAALEKEMLEAENAEAEAAEELKDRRAKEYEKAKAVKMQKKLWQSGLEARIMMQKVLQGTNKLPGSEAHVVMEDVDPTLAQEMRGVASDAKRALGDLCEILDCLAEINPAVASRASGATSSKRRRVREEDGLRACWAALDARYAEFGAFRDASLDRWHRKTMIESGKTTASSMKILNQGISKQVGLLMKDVDRIAERSRLRAGEFQGLCQVRRTTNDPESDDPAANDALVPETYVDTDFYSALLNEFLEASSNVNASKLHKAPKQRKIVDRRASKGRKLRYQIHEKLVNFMTPVEEERASYTANIFSNLFGHKR